MPSLLTRRLLPRSPGLLAHSLAPLNTQPRAQFLNRPGHTANNASV